MLLLLTLALLAGPTCRAQNILGRKVGTYFYIRGEDQGEIKVIRVYLTIAKCIMGIQLQFGSHWSDVYGSNSLDYKDFQLKDGEHVIKVHGKEANCLCSLTFTTNQGTEFTFGFNRGKPFDNSGGPDKHLVTVNGMYTPHICIQGMGFKWTHGPQDVGSTQLPGNPKTSLNTSKKKKADKDKDKDDDDDNDDDDNDAPVHLQNPF
ncbi:prostatic spermine-binding protein-like [Microtus ochrogaster]|uniref:Prostatic spermine-binding protein-like n=1 Tax=Microtus ochrogaster TaxID=79684 RepID=A0ABM0KPH9_MICOH|nr:prostatic spermine-binding protein-like [Microtus ochrogaster]